MNRVPADSDDPFADLFTEVELPQPAAPLAAAAPEELDRGSRAIFAFLDRASFGLAMLLYVGGGAALVVGMMMLLAPGPFFATLADPAGAAGSLVRLLGQLGHILP